MQRILPSKHSWPLHNRSSTQRIENQAQAKEAPHMLMRRAGEAVARLTRAIAPHARRIWVAAGPGNNGGDGLEVALQLHQFGLQVHVTMTADLSRLPTDASNALARATAAGVQISADPSALPFLPEFAIDALLGAGANRPPTEPIVALIHQLNAQQAPILAIDLPTGLNGDTGQPFGDDCIRAKHTLSLLTLKPGLFTGTGRDYSGTVWLDDLKVNEESVAPDAWLWGGFDARHKPRLHAQHKGTFGDVLVVGGCPAMVGAALLAARAAHAAGAGRVYVSLLGHQSIATDTQHPELMFRPAEWPSDVESLHRTTVVCGCGGGETVREALPRLLSVVQRLVLDADALNAIALDINLQRLLRARSSKGFATVITPHPLEAARLLGTKAAVIQADRLAAAHQLANRFGCVVVLKGSGTVITSLGFPPIINPTGNASLATAGTGDVLAGWLAGDWSAHRGADTPVTDALNAAKRSVWWHGNAADLVPNAVLLASDLIEAMSHLARTSHDTALRLQAASCN